MALEDDAGISQEGGTEAPREPAPGAPAAHPLSAPVRLPAPEELEVRLVNASNSERLDEYNVDFAVMLGCAMLFAGSLLSLVVAAALQKDGLDSRGIVVHLVVGAMLLIPTTIFGYWAHIFRARYRRARSGGHMPRQ
ncbi:MAG TPA: hypothetical protein VF647_13795 [Longimicrobium sp.]|jgi:hypothetical protein